MKEKHYAWYLFWTAMKCCSLQSNDNIIHLVQDKPFHNKANINKKQLVYNLSWKSKYSVC